MTQQQWKQRWLDEGTAQVGVNCHGYQIGPGCQLPTCPECGYTARLPEILKALGLPAELLNATRATLSIADFENRRD